MIVLMVVEAMLTAATTWLVINAGRKVADAPVRCRRPDLDPRRPNRRPMWSASSAGSSPSVPATAASANSCCAFARENRDKVKLLNEKPAREQVEPFLTGETFQCFFNVMYELEFALKLFLGPGVQRAACWALKSTPACRSPMSARSPRCCSMQWVLQKPLAARLSRKPAHEQPRHRAGLYRVGQHLQRQQLQSRAYGSPASRPGCARD